MRIKFWLIRIGFLLLFGGLLAHIYNVQVLQKPYYTQRAAAQAEAAGALEPSRGVLFFTDKNQNTYPAVVNKEYPLVFAVPIEIENPRSDASAIAPIFGLDADALAVSFAKPRDQYEVIAEKANPQQVAQVRDLGIQGIHTRSEIFRFYPGKEMAAHVLGFVASAPAGGVEGKYGIELLFNEELREEKDIHLTIDRNVQVESERIIRELVEEWEAESASVLVQEPISGKILAMANLPAFDPNTYGSYPISSFLNQSVQSVYEPGSVFKIITMSAGFDSGKLTPETTYEDPGYVILNGKKLQNWDLKAHGLQTMRQVIEKSLNTGTVFAERRIGHDTFRDYVRAFGFGEKTGIRLPGEVDGSLHNISKREDVNYATASYGQGISVTPIQMISAASAIANKGLLMRPLIRADEAQEVIRRVMSEETAREMTGVLVGSVDVNVLAHIPQYEVAGKTGTAFVPDFTRGGYTDQVINTFIGYAPASDPKFTILIKLVKPKNAPLAGQTVVPAFKKLTEYLLNYYQIAPDRIANG
ncbi:hypothetical protein A2755_02810 [Candidatus Wolfebacteria bacterium RIFCSPHIGHO2_01_FULL_48_22]|uniref:Penicillin-binding protein transpeptidase domain-containing protein n=2 Tax=Candidatus Wolfeibacteriota TaxID=1752735 RepID=A0A1F8DTI2_9BACT|nr:MAG: hypothetical protein A2755_02810 [Candidatus Wolfebacteria bacterium RIFCSPHIGHO2_01_FULL_48_22]OGM92202.1 MAG: hypothetical protein A2935_00255 [Candidatus Wolfebacteria bacterium RIFCSPLOWO2_01_FULL_47_17b]